MKAPWSGSLSNGQDLPKSNHQKEAGISHVTPEVSVLEASFDRRAIPPDAVESRWLAPDGYPIRRIEWPAPAGDQRGSVLFLPGRADAYEKYLEAFEDWRQRGWKVTAADWRGQGGSGRLGLDSDTSHIDDFATWVNDLAALWTQWKATTPGPHVLAGHSMGGHLALRALAERRIDPAGLVLVAPMLGLNGRLPEMLIHGLARLMCVIGDPRRKAWKWNERPGKAPLDRSELLTHDLLRYADELWWRDHREETSTGPGSWRWVERAYASMRGLKAPGLLEAIATPVLILAAVKDRLVSVAAIERAAARLPQVELVRFGSEARHEILREADPVRHRALAVIDGFLDRVAPPRHGVPS
jgi:lysophospholipase